MTGWFWNGRPGSARRDDVALGWVRRRPFAVAVTAVALAAGVAVTGPVAAAVAEPWDLAADFHANAKSSFPANPFSDGQGNPSVWGMLAAAGTVRDPRTYTLMSFATKSLCGYAGVVAWTGAADHGEAHINTTEGAINRPSCAPSAVFPPHVAMCTPAP